MSLAGITLAAECQCCICQWSYPEKDARWHRFCSECGRKGLDHVESDPCLYPRFFPTPSTLEVKENP